MSLIRTFLSIARSTGIRAALQTTLNFLHDRRAKLLLLPRLRRLIPVSSGTLNDDELLAAVRCLPEQVMAYKTLGLILARQLTPLLDGQNIDTPPSAVDLVSKATTQHDMESPWFAYWCKELAIAPVFHRKLWEYAFTLQALHESGVLQAGNRGLGFGCGEEPLASYFAAKGLQLTVSDQSAESADGWRESGQHASSLEDAYHPQLVSRARFEAHVTHRTVDMNAIPVLNVAYDFCWSLCAMEHLGSIERGLHFVESAMACLRPGGIAVFTTEFNYRSDSATVDHMQTVLFRRKDFIELQQRLERQGDEMLGPDFDVGDAPLDQFIDLPPYSQLGPAAMHLKLAIAGFPATCFGIIVRKGLHAR